MGPVGCRRYGFLWWNPVDNENYDALLEGYLREKGYYDWPAWDHPERGR